MMNPGDFTWIFGFGMVFAFMDAYGIGANDVANAFATSVSSGSLTLIQASIVACFTEFLGALLLGASTSSTIKDGIISIDNFKDQPEILMLGMLCAVFGSAIWVVFASKRGWPVSTTHSIVGALCGVGISAFGGSGIKWEWGGISSIVASWFISPIISGFVAAIFFSIVKYAVLRRADSFTWGLRLVPFFFFATITVEVAYIVLKAPGSNAKNMHEGVIAAIAIGCGIGSALFAWFFYVPWARRIIKNKEDLRWYHVPFVPFLGPRPTIQVADPELNAPTAAGSSSNSTDGKDDTLDEKQNIKGDELEATTRDETPEAPTGTFAHYKKKITDILLHGLRQDVRNIGNSKLKNVHAAAVLYDDDAEYLFSFLQILTACAASFAHGSNDVANAVGPLSAIFSIWQSGVIQKKVDVPIWVLAYGGVAIDIGLVTLGYKVMGKLGNNITFMTPTRGFSAELGAALTVITASQLGIPVSTTHCIVGGTVGVGLCNGNVKSINWKMILEVFFAWVVTLPAAGLIAGLLFAFGTNAPNLVR